MTTTIRNDRATWLYGPSRSCRRPPNVRERPSRLVLLTPPGLARIPLAECLCAAFGVCHLAIEDVFRVAQPGAATDPSPHLNLALHCRSHGVPVSESTIIELVRERRNCLACPGGFLLDGFPQTVLQARCLDQWLAAQHLCLEAVLNYQLPLAEVMARARGWQTCQVCHARFHRVEHPAQTSDVCDHCGGLLVVSAADHPEILASRWLEYEQHLKPVLAYYLERGLVRTISAAGPPQRVLARTAAILDL